MRDYKKDSIIAEYKLGKRKEKNGKIKRNTIILIDRLKCDPVLRRICSWEKVKEIPSESTFSRAFAEFSNSELPERVHEALIKKNYQEQISTEVQMIKNNLLP